MSVIMLCGGGPYDFDVLVLDASKSQLPSRLRFPTEPLKDIYGNRSVCAPRPSPIGPIVYEYTGDMNVVGQHIYKWHDKK